MRPGYQLIVVEKAVGDTEEKCKARKTATIMEMFINIFRINICQFDSTSFFKKLALHLA